MMFSFLSNVRSDYRSPFAQLGDFDKAKTKDVANQGSICNLSVHPETLDSIMMPYQLVKNNQNLDFPDISWGNSINIH